MVKTLQAADLKTQDGSLDAALLAGSGFAIPAREPTKIGNTRAGAGWMRPLPTDWTLRGW